MNRRSEIATHELVKTEHELAGSFRLAEQRPAAVGGHRRGAGWGDVLRGRCVPATLQGGAMRNWPGQQEAVAPDELELYKREVSDTAIGRGADWEAVGESRLDGYRGERSRARRSRLEGAHILVGKSKAKRSVRAIQGSPRTEGFEEVRARSPNHEGLWDKFAGEKRGRTGHSHGTLPSGGSTGPRESPCRRLHVDGGNLNQAIGTRPGGLNPGNAVIVVYSARAPDHTLQRTPPTAGNQLAWSPLTQRGDALVHGCLTLDFNAKETFSRK